MKVIAGTLFVGIFLFALSTLRDFFNEIVIFINLFSSLILLTDFKMSAINITFKGLSE